MDVPFHRYADGHDLSELALEKCSNLPGICVDALNRTAIELRAVDLVGARDHAVLIRTDDSWHWGTERYAKTHPHLTADSAQRLVDAGVACVGIDSLNIDSTHDGNRPVHTTLLGVEIPIVEHLTNLGRLPERVFTFSAVPPKIVGAGTSTVRAHAFVP